MLLDTKIPGASASGGTGAVFDWGVARRLASPPPAGQGIPVIVAGGLSDANVGEALSAVGTTSILGVDASSGLETNSGPPGEKDLEKVRDYVQTALSKGRSQ